MTSGELSDYILGHFEADSDHSFEEDRSVTVFRRSDDKKWFAALKNIGYRYLNIDRVGRIDILNVRLDPRTIAKLRTREGFLPAWKMNQNNWVTILLDGSVADDEIRALLDKGFGVAGTKGRRR